METNIGSMPANEKLDGTNYNLWNLKVQFLLNNGDMVEFLTASMSTSAEWHEHGKEVTIGEQYQEKLKAYQNWFKSDRSTRYILFSCMHDDLSTEFEHCPTAKDMWGRLKIWFSKTSTTRLVDLLPNNCEL